jgi:molybdate transport system regulatory protein
MPAGKPSKARTKKSPYSCRGRIWIDGPEGTFLGYGRVVLLERIRQYGSITKAAKSMDMSYRHAWQLVDSMNMQAPEPLVTTASGGKGGGGTGLTVAGEDAVSLFWRFYAGFQEFLVKQAGSTLLDKEKPKEDL